MFPPPKKNTLSFPHPPPVHGEKFSFVFLEVPFFFFDGRRPKGFPAVRSLPLCQAVGRCGRFILVIREFYPIPPVNQSRPFWFARYAETRNFHVKLRVRKNGLQTPAGILKPAQLAGKTGRVQTVGVLGVSRLSALEDGQRTERAPSGIHLKLHFELQIPIKTHKKQYNIQIS